MLLGVPFRPALRLVLALIAKAIRLRAILNWNKNSLLRNDKQLTLQSTSPESWTVVSQPCIGGSVDYVAHTVLQTLTFEA